MFERKSGRKKTAVRGLKRHKLRCQELDFSCKRQAPINISTVYSLNLSLCLRIFVVQKIRTSLRFCDTSLSLREINDEWQVATRNSSDLLTIDDLRFSISPPCSQCIQQLFVPDVAGTFKMPQRAGFAAM